MAATAAGTRLTERHRTDQLRVRAVFLREVIRQWPLLDPRRLDDTAPAWLDLMARLVRAYRQRSADTALTYYDGFRAAELGAPPLEHRGRYSVDGVNEEQVRTSLAVTGPANIKHRTRRGDNPEQAARSALVSVSGSSSRHVLDGGRDMIDTVTSDDSVALGWARVTDNDPCAFCAMLASRGPVYTSQRSGGFTAHDHCGCAAEPVFSRGQPWPGRAEYYAAVWAEATRRKSGKDALAAFRAALKT